MNTTKNTYAPCPRCKVVAAIKTEHRIQVCGHCGAKWTRERNVNG